jgi:hypothetical protein
MALYLRDQGKRSELQDRIAAELREKMASQSDMEEPDLPDGVDDSAYLKSYEKKAGPNSRVVVLLVVLFVILVVIGLLIVLAR